MSQSLKAALFSAFIFPGSGQFLLKKHIRGALLASISILCVWVLLSTALEKAQEISRKIESGEIPLDITRITEEVSRLAAGSGTQQAEIATYVLLIFWLVGIVDAYWLGRLQDKANSRPDSQP
jgi:TM2 domain-containing membrane protein YozV